MRAYKARELDLNCGLLQYEIGKTYRIDGELKNCKCEFRACPRINDVFNHFFIRSKVFEVELGGKIIEDEDEVCGDEITYIRELSKKEIIENIEDDEHRYKYCKCIEDRKDLWSKITDDYYKLSYCYNIKDRKKLWSSIEDDKHIYNYCKHVKDREELWSKITSDRYKFFYCKHVKDREELWSKITNDRYKKYYCREIRFCKELWSTIKDNE